MTITADQRARLRAEAVVFHDFHHPFITAPPGGDGDDVISSSDDLKVVDADLDLPGHVRDSLEVIALDCETVEIGGCKAAFLEFHGGTQPPNASDLMFLDEQFSDGDAAIRTGYASHVGARGDPVEAVNNHILPMDLLDLDIGGLDPTDFAVPGGTEYIGSHSHPVPGAVVLEDIGGVEVSAGDFPQSTTEWWEHGAGGGDPDSAEGTGASSWPNPAERMWTIYKLFEQTHTDRELWYTQRIKAGFDDGRLDWLDPATGLR